MEEARHCKARSATLARSSSEKLGAVLQRDIIIVINVLTQRGLIVLVSRFISPSRWIVKSLTKQYIYIYKKKKYKKTRSYLEPILLRTPLSILRVTNNHGIRNDRIEEEEEEEEGCLIFVSTRNNFTRMMIGGVWKGRDDHFLSLRPLLNESEKEGRGEVGRKGWAKILKVHRVYRAGNDLRRSSPSDLSKDTRNLRGASARASSESRSVYVSHLPSNQTGHRLLRSNILLLFYS